MPPTTGGSTRGSNTSERTTDSPRNVVRANTNAIGTPNRMHRAVLANEVRRLRVKAAIDESLVTSDGEVRPVHPREHRHERQHDEQATDRRRDEHPGR